MLLLAELVEHPEITCLYLPVEDFEPTPPELIKQGVEFVRDQKDKGNRILVACGAGINRSKAFCTAALKEIEGLDLLDAYADIWENHKEALPHPPVWQSLCEYYQGDIPFQVALSQSQS